MICPDPADGLLVLEKMMVERVFGDAGDKVIVEEQLKRIEAMKEGCEECHETERYYFVDQTVLDDIEALGNAFQSTPPNSETIGGLLGKVGEESCSGCHLVHQPAEQLKHLWEFMAMQE